MAFLLRLGVNNLVAKLWAASAMGEFKSVNQTLTSLIEGEQTDEIERTTPPKQQGDRQLKSVKIWENT